MSCGFRLTVVLAAGHRLGRQEPECEIPLPELIGTVLLKGLGSDTIGSAGQLAFIGAGYETENLARTAGETLGNALRLAAIANRVPLDVGKDDTFRTGAGPAMKETAAEDGIRSSELGGRHPGACANVSRSGWWVLDPSAQTADANATATGAWSFRARSARSSIHGSPDGIAAAREAGTNSHASRDRSGSSQPSRTSRSAASRTDFFQSEVSITSASSRFVTTPSLRNSSSWRSGAMPDGARRVVIRS